MPNTSNDDSDPRPFNLSKAFLRRQEVLAAELGVTASFTEHPTTIGDASEANWVDMLRSVLPNRYGVGPIFAVDHLGHISQQVDIAVYDQQYAPLFFTSKTGVRIVPAESIYAVFEVKPEINKSLTDYSGGKIASVRRLARTSGDIHHINGVTAGPHPDTKPILGGILAARWGWATRDSDAAPRAIRNLADFDRVDLGLALDTVAFDHRPDGDIRYSPVGTQLIFFALHLFRRLQPLATALAPDLDEYERFLVTPGEVPVGNDDEIPDTALGH
jgi:hypothetical protein